MRVCIKNTNILFRDNGALHSKKCWIKASVKSKTSYMSMSEMIFNEVYKWLGPMYSKKASSYNKLIYLVVDDTALKRLEMKNHDRLHIRWIRNSILLIL